MTSSPPSASCARRTSPSHSATTPQSCTNPTRYFSSGGEGGDAYGLQDDDLDGRVHAADALREVVRGRLVARVVDGDVRAGGGELEGDDGAEASASRRRVNCVVRRGGAGGGVTDREPAVTRTARLASERGIFSGVAGWFFLSLFAWML
jgi:hypothetical protein